MYPDFNKKYKRDTPAFLAADWQAYAGRVPDGFLDFMKETGVASFDNGYIWTVAPGDYEAILADWNLNSDEDVVVARTGMGDLLLWNGEEVYILDAHRGTLEQVTGSIEILFNYFLCDQRYLDEMHFRRQFQEAITISGPLSPDTCLHFVPALALGGADAAGNLQRVDINICHSLLSQIHIPKT